MNCVRLSVSGACDADLRGACSWEPPASGGLQAGYYLQGCLHSCETLQSERR
jgi:hypothetical protein